MIKALITAVAFFVTLAARIAQATDRPDVMQLCLMIAVLLISLSGGLMLITVGLRVVCLFSRPIKEGETAHD